nr:immunoglobulin heavy chain junction region [Mus musculus]
CARSSHYYGSSPFAYW